MVPVSLYTFNFGYYGLVVMSLVLFFSKAERLFQFLLRGVSVLHIFASMKVWDVNTGKVIDNRPDIEVSRDWYTTAEGRIQYFPSDINRTIYKTMGNMTYKGKSEYISPIKVEFPSKIIREKGQGRLTTLDGSTKVNTSTYQKHLTAEGNFSKEEIEYLALRNMELEEKVRHAKQLFAQGAIVTEHLDRWIYDRIFELTHENVK